MMGRVIISSLIIFIVFFINTCTSYALQTVKVEYQVPIDYKYLNETEINTKAEKFYEEYMSTNDVTALQNMLSSYCLLTNINKENPLYFVRVGIAYGKLKKDKWAKSYFCQSMCILYNYPYSYSAFGDFWFERCQYRKALHNYLTADKFGYNDNYNNLYQIASCYEKLGDYKAAIEFFKSALKYNKKEELNQDLMNRIQSLEEILERNSLYYEKERRTY